MILRVAWRVACRVAPGLRDLFMVPDEWLDELDQVIAERVELDAAA